MAYTLNTSHALYGNLLELIGVQSGALVSHKTARTFTKHAEASYGTGTYGEHLSTVNGGYTPKGASFSPALVRDTYTNPNYTIVEVFNSVGAGNASVAFINNNGGTYTFSSPSWSNTRLAGVSTCYVNSVQSATTLGTGAVMLSTTRADGAGNVRLYVNADQVATANPESFNANTGINYLGGYDGQGAYAADLVWVAIFDKVLSAAEIADLYASLGANNTFGLVSSGTPSTDGSGSGSLDSLDLIAPTGTGTGTAAGSTNGTGTGAFAAASLTAVAGTGAGTVAGSGTITTPVLKNNTGTVLASITNWTVHIYNAASGAYITTISGLSTNASGIISITSSSLSAGTTYTYEPVHSTYGRRLPTAVAA